MRRNALLLLPAAVGASPAYPCGAPPPPFNTLLNNTRLDYAVPAPAPFVSDSPAACLAYCVNDTSCGGMVFKQPWEPLPVEGCEGRLPTQGMRRISTIAR